MARPGCECSAAADGRCVENVGAATTPDSRYAEILSEERIADGRGVSAAAVLSARHAMARAAVSECWLTT
jgi:hypothetical protein